VNRQSMERLKLDRRLFDRKNWISQAELDAVMAALPDVSDKIAVAETEEAAGSPGAEAGSGPS
jgi:hypothetical protein